MRFYLLGFAQPISKRNISQGLSISQHSKHAAQCLP
jgi:hypothetical protein